MGSIVVFGVDIKRSLRASIQHRLQKPFPIPGAGYISRLFSRVSERRRRGALGGQSPTVKTIVIGGQTFGGAGKTPVAVYIVQMLLAQEVKVGLLLRPTRAGNTFEGLVTDWEAASASGDEAAMVWRILRDRAPIFVFRDLVQGQEFAEKDLDILVVDDGLRVRDLSCDLSVVVIDRSSTDQVFPLGPCRESSRLLEDVDLIWLNKINEPNRRGEIVAHVRSVYEPLELVNSDGKTMSLERLRAHSITICSGIGRPESFYHTLRPWVERVNGIFEYGDHEPFIFPKISSPNELIVTTEKDLARGGGGSHVWALRTRLKVEVGDAYLKQRIEALVTV